VVRVGDVDDQRLDTPDCVGVPVAPDTREDVENPRRASSRAVAAPMPVDAPVTMAISWISGDAVMNRSLPVPEAQIFQRAIDSPELAEGLSASLEKRAPRWRRGST